MTNTRQRQTDPLSTKDVADAIGRTPATVRLYTGKFEGFLSSQATPAKGARRTFTQDDLRILYAASRLLDAGLQYDEVRQRLREGAADLEEFQIPPEAEDVGEEETAPGTAMINLREFQALTQPLRDAAAEWRQIAEDRRIENEELREENRRLRGELREAQKRSERPWWRRLFGLE